MPKPNEVIPPELEILETVRAISKAVFNIDEDVNRIDRDMASDRKDFEQVKVNQVTLNAKMDSVMELLTRFQFKTKEAVKDAVSEETADMQEQMKKIVKKPIVRVTSPARTLATKISDWWHGIYDGR